MVAASGPLLVSVTVKVIVSPTLGVGLLTVLVELQVGLLRRLGGAVGVVAGVRVELIGVAEVAVFVCGWASITVAVMVSVCGTPAATVPTVQSPVAGL